MVKPLQTPALRHAQCAAFVLQPAKLPYLPDTHALPVTFSLPLCMKDSFFIDATIGMRAEEIALCLDQIRGQSF